MSGPLPVPPAGPRLRDALGAIPRYRAGAAAPTSDAGHGRAFKLASNENPFGPLPGVVAAAGDALATVNRYPDFASTHLVHALALFTGRTIDELAVGTGSVALLQNLVQLTCDDGDEVVYAWRSFEAYPIVTRIVGAVPVEVPLTSDHRHDVDAMLRAVGPRTRLVIACSPNNPTGTAMSVDEIDALLAGVQPDVLVALDQAYIEYVPDDDRPDVATLLAQHPNLVVLRTFSKAFGLAGLRVGYAQASVPVADALRAVATPFGVSSVAQAAAVASLAPGALADLRARVGVVTQQRDDLMRQLREYSVAAAESSANFVWLPVGSDADQLGTELQSAGLSVRVFPAEGVRITIGEEEANARALETVAAWSRRGAR